MLWELIFLTAPTKHLRSHLREYGLMRFTVWGDTVYHGGEGVVAGD